MFGIPHEGERLTMLADVQWAKIWKWHAVIRIFMHGGGKVSIPFLREIFFRGECISNTGDFLLKWQPMLKLKQQLFPSDEILETLSARKWQGFWFKNAWSCFLIYKCLKSCNVVKSCVYICYLAFGQFYGTCCENYYRPHARTIATEIAHNCFLFSNCKIFS